MTRVSEFELTGDVSPCRIFKMDNWELEDAEAHEVTGIESQNFVAQMRQDLELKDWREMKLNLSLRRQIGSLREKRRSLNDAA